jgi:glycosyltransferase involved in cell wall biosynthesis
MKFLINTITHWEEPPRTRHFVTNSLAKNHEVVFIAANKFGFPGLKVNQINPNLRVIVPTFPIDNRIRYRMPVLNELYQYWLFRILARRFPDYKVINFDFTATRVFGFFNDVIYYCNDSYALISKAINSKFTAKYHAWCEAKVTAKSRFCVGISELIMTELRRYNSNLVEIPLGSPDIEDFNINIHTTPTKNTIIQVGLVAVIKNLNISHNVINCILEDDSLCLTLVGPIEEGFLDYIPKKDKLIILGPLTGKKLYDRINEFDVTLSPYQTKTTNEIFSGTGSKIYHYLSVGKPVVISQMSGLSQLNLKDKFIYPAKEEEDFPALIHKAHEENTSDLILQRIAYAKNNTWIKRMEILIDFYQQYDNLHRPGVN